MSEHTITVSRTDVTQFFTWLAENDVTVTTQHHISRSHLIDYLSHLADQGRSGVTRARKLTAIRQYCMFLVDENRPTSSSATNIAIPKKERKSRVFLRVDDYLRLLNAAAGHSPNYAFLQLCSDAIPKLGSAALLVLSHSVVLPRNQDRYERHAVPD